MGAVKKVLACGRYVSNSLAKNLAASLSANHEAPQEKLSDREFQVLQLASGRMITDIARKLSLSVKTISTCLSRILEKWA